jgi:type IV secretory pathway ATPase VirB11/archaellum biosynthesis ATPase
MGCKKQQQPLFTIEKTHTIPLFQKEVVSLQQKS